MTAVLVLGAVLVFAALFLAVRTVLDPPRPTRLQPARPAPRPGVGDRMTEVRTRATGVADQLLDRHGRRPAVEAALEQAGIGTGAGEVVVLVAVSVLVAGVAGTVLAGPALGLVLAAAVAAGPVVVVRIRTERRRQAFAEQLPDLLQVLAGNLRVGHGLHQALESAGHEFEEPAAGELRRAMAEVRLGRDVGTALEDVASRMSSDDFGWIAQAVGINREVGGDLAEVFDSVGETIRARAHLARQVKALSAEGRLSAYVLLALPFVVGALLALINPGYMSLLFTRSLGVAMLVGSGALMAVGALWLRRLVRPVY